MEKNHINVTPDTNDFSWAKKKRLISCYDNNKKKYVHIQPHSYIISNARRDL